MVAKTKKQPAKPTKARRPKNAPEASANGDGYLPGLEPIKIEPVHTLAEELKDVRTKRIKLLAKEVELEDELIEAMHDVKNEDGTKGLTVYQYGDVKARITKSSKEKVKIEKPEPRTDSKATADVD